MALGGQLPQAIQLVCAKIGTKPIYLVMLFVLTGEGSHVPSLRTVALIVVREKVTEVLCLGGL